MKEEKERMREREKESAWAKEELAGNFSHSKQIFFPKESAREEEKGEERKETISLNPLLEWSTHTTIALHPHLAALAALSLSSCTVFLLNCSLYSLCFSLRITSNWYTLISYRCFSTLNVNLLINYYFLNSRPRQTYLLLDGSSSKNVLCFCISIKWALVMLCLCK